VRCCGTMPVRGVLGVGNEDGKLPSLAETIAAVRRELSSAQQAGQGQPVQFRTGPVELEFEVAVTRTGGGEAGVQLWVVTLGAKGELGHASTQRIKVTLQPVNPQTGEDAQIGDAFRGPGSAGPPP
jgi:Trypsin-co-occurring domain 2